MEPQKKTATEIEINSLSFLKTNVGSKLRQYK